MPEYHAKLSPSASARWLECPGSIILEKQLQDQNKIPSERTANKYAAEGTVVHKILEICANDYIDTGDFGSPERFLNEVLEADGFKFLVNQEMVDCVNIAINYISTRIEDLELDDYRVELKSETWLDLTSLKVKGLDGGTGDISILAYDLDNNLDSLEIFDYKNGSGVYVEAENNTQLLCYGLGAIIKFAGNEIPRSVTMTICQPRIPGISEDQYIRPWEVTGDFVLNWTRKTLVPNAKKTYLANAPFKATEKGCRWCPCSANCEARYDMTLETAMVDFDNIEEGIQTPLINQLSAERKIFIAKYGHLVIEFINNVKESILEEIDKGSKDYEKEFKLVKGRSSRKLNDNAFDEFDSPLMDYLDEDEVIRTSNKPMTEIESLLKHKVGPKKTAEIMKQVTTINHGNITLAPLTDKRRAELPSVVNDFTDLD